MFKSILMTTLAGHALAIDYTQYGANWYDLDPTTNAACKGDYQSPINLRTTWGEVPYANDKFFKHYEDFDSGKTKWPKDKYTSVIAVPYKQPITGTAWNYFTSAYSNITQEFKAAQFHFHAKSEHTIDDIQFDFEMHTVHLLDEQKDGYFAGVQGIIFDTKNYDKSVTDQQIEIIDKFFDSLNLDKLDPEKGIAEVAIKNVPYGQLMNLLQTDKRYVYTGSLTTPPCTEKVYWNVATRVYPISGKHLHQFTYLLGKEKSMAEKANKKSKIKLGGNYRVVQPIKKQNPVILTSEAKDEDTTYYEETNSVLLIVLIFILVNILIELGLNYAIYIKKQEKDAEREKMASFKNRQMVPLTPKDADSIEFAPVSAQPSGMDGLQKPNQEGSRISKVGLMNQDNLVKMSSGNFASEIENAGQNLKIEDKMQGGDPGDGAPSPSQVMRNHSNSQRTKQ